MNIIDKIKLRLCGDLLSNASLQMQIEDLDGNKIVFIHDIIFKGKRSIKWEDVEEYLKQFVKKEYLVVIEEVIWLKDCDQDRTIGSDYNSKLCNFFFFKYVEKVASFPS